MVDRKSALGIVNALRRGVPPEYDLETFSVCRGDILDQFRDDLAVSAAGASRLRYIDADLGQGKTHLLKLLRSAAFSHDFLVSIVELSAAECPLYRLTDVYHKMVTGLRTRDSPREPAIENIMERWLEKQRDAGPTERKRALTGLPLAMRAALVAYLQASNFLQPSPERRDVVLRWLGGEQLSLKTRSSLQLLENIADETALQMLGGMAALAREIGYAGVCILFDEAEAIVSFGRSSQRAQALTNLVRIVRQSEGSHGMYFVYAATPSFFDLLDVNERLLPRDTDGLILSPRPLERDCLEELATRLAALHATAYGWSPPEAKVKAVAATLTPGVRLSDSTKKVVASLDELREVAP